MEEKLNDVLEELRQLNKNLDYIENRLVHYLEGLVSMAFVLIVLLGILLYRLW